MQLQFLEYLLIIQKKRFYRWQPWLDSRYPPLLREINAAPPLLFVRGDADALIAEAERELEKSVDLWQFASLINENYSNEEKIEIIETLWRIVYVDGKMDQYEHYLMNKLQNLLRLTHDQLIAAKLKVLHAEK